MALKPGGSRLPVATIIEPEQLSELLNTAGIRIVDLSEKENYANCHIPGAVHMDYGRLVAALPEHNGPLIKDSSLYALLSEAGIDADTHVIVYDEADNAKACRLIWTLDLIGHSHYSLLNGGLHSWLDERHPAGQSAITPEPSEPQYEVTLTPYSVDLLYLLQNLNNDNLLIVDCRTPEEYRGEDIRAQRGGHIPGAVNFDYRLLIEPEHSNRIHPPAELEKLFAQHGIRPKHEIVVHCHSHRRSALVYQALRSLGYPNVKAYPGSWAEWGNNLDTPVE